MARRIFVATRPFGRPITAGGRRPLIARLSVIQGDAIVDGIYEQMIRPLHDKTQRGFDATLVHIEVLKKEIAGLKAELARLKDDKR